MKLPFPKITAALVMFLLLTAIIPVGLAIAGASPLSVELPSWKMKFVHSETDNVEEAEMASKEDWIHVISHEKVPETPVGMSSVWIKLPLTYINGNSAVLIDKVYGDSIKAFLNHTLVYDSQNLINYNGRKVLIPLSMANDGAELYLWTNGGTKALGIEGSVTIGDYNQLLGAYTKQGLLDLIIGATLIFIAIVLMICSFFLKRGYFPGGLLLVIVIFCIGVMIITYSSFVPTILGKYGKHFDFLFGLALYTLLPSFTFYFEKIFGPGRKRIIPYFRKFQIGYSILCLALMIVETFWSDHWGGLTRFITVSLLGIIMILQFVLLLSLALINAYRRNEEAMIFSVGFLVFVLVSITELIMYYTSSGVYYLYWWKWGMVVFVISMIVILGRRFSKSHEQLMEYSRRLEKFNNDLQRSEKMEIISELAASVAHEVRNPLQVTRGFLQILGERSEKKEKEYLNMAVAELDRATLIITDFLTFAKPGLETLGVLEVSEELSHVSAILLPLANLQGGVIELKLQPGLHVLGSSPKFKQAFINIIKNSIEALQMKNGFIEVSTWKSADYIFISVRDNGEGMNASEMARLGEPYYSNKTKGTGLGLMVTFRIIEAMEGTTKFQSEKGVGTEIVVKLPNAGNK